MKLNLNSASFLMSPDPRTPSPHAPPRQERSRETLERILTAAEGLLEERLFEELTMSAIAHRAGVAVGTIYTRFRRKDEVLPVLFERHDRAVAERVRPFFARLARQRSLRGRIESVVAFAVDYHQRHRGLLRALTMYVRAHPDRIPTSVRSVREEQYRAVAEAVCGDGRGILHDDPLEATLFAMALVNSACREQLLFDDVTPVRRSRSGLAAFERRLTETIHRDLAGRVR